MRRILVPTDFSAVANNAVRYAIEFSKHSPAEFFFFHAGKSSVEELQEKITALTGHTSANSPHKMHFMAVDIDFNPQVIHHLVQQNRITLIIMGTHGSELSPMPIFGNTTTDIIEHSSIPLIAVPELYLFSEIATIAYSADLVGFEYELEVVVSFARSVNAAVDVFHITPVFPALLNHDKVNVSGIIEEVKQKKAFPYIQYHLDEMEKDNEIHKGIHEHLDEHPASLLALFHSSREWIDQILDPGIVVKEISHIRIPTIVFPKKLL